MYLRQSLIKAGGGCPDFGWPSSSKGLMDLMHVNELGIRVVHSINLD